MKIYPNPARSTAYIRVPSQMKGQSSLTVTNRKGIVIEERAFSADETKLLALDLTGQPNGLYNVYLSDEQLVLCDELLNLVDQNSSVPMS